MKTSEFLSHQEPLPPASIRLRDQEEKAFPQDENTLFPSPLSPATSMTSNDRPGHLPVHPELS